MGMDISYHQMDTNSAEFPINEYDIIINHAAAHHIAYINKVFRRLCEILPEDGIFLNYDYVGPHRNQYTWEIWNAAFMVNEELPKDVRQDMTNYPHLPTMLVTDPTEAIHSELIVPTFHRYFNSLFYRPLGGGIAYPLLTHNTQIANANSTLQDAAVVKICMEDERFSTSHPGSELFAFFAGTPNKNIINNNEKMEYFQSEEDQREINANNFGGVYGEKKLLSFLYETISDLKLKANR
jgi:hypothetical protein